MIIKIESGKTMPHIGRRGRGAKYPYDELKVSQSFVYPTETKEATARSTASAFGTRHKKKFTISNSKGILTCWRVE